MYQEECGWQALLSGLVNHAAAEDRCEDLCVADLVRLDRKDVRRSNLKGIDKATTEFGLVALAHNLERFSSNH